MKQIGNLKNIINEICLKLSQDQKLIRLLVDDSLKLDSDLDFTSYSLENLLSQHYFCTYPIIETGINESTRNTFLVFKVATVTFSEAGSQTMLNGNIYVTTDINHHLLSNGKDRMLEICERICMDLDTNKFTSASNFEINSISDIIVGNDRAGYVVGFSCYDIRSESEILI